MRHLATGIFSASQRVRVPSPLALHHIRPRASIWRTASCTFSSESIHEADKGVFITTPIFYVNASPHIGHVHSAVLADALARWYRVKQRDVLFTTGTDEHGLKVQEAAEASGTTDYAAFCDDVSSRFRAIFGEANVDYSRFIRTSERDHHVAVDALWRVIHANGHIYLGEHESWYCKSDESFLTETQVEDRTDAQGNTHKVSKESGHNVEKLREENYKFRLSAFQQPLLEWLDASPDVVVPKSRFNEVRAAVAAGLRDVSVSRLREKIRWAIDVPDDDEHCVYVWLDALTNYLTCAGYPGETARFWPADYHIVGKDIIKFHAIYWPAFLMAAGLPLPKKIVAHAHWTVDNVKMSKSLGNVVDPHAAIEKYGADFIRYFLLREGVLNDDGDFSTAMLEERVNSELADTLGNLVSRSTAKSFLRTGELPPRPHYLTPGDEELVTRGQSLAATVETLFETPDFSAGIKEIIFYLHEVNKYFTVNEPWVLAKQLRAKPDDAELQRRLDTVLYLTIDSVRMSAILLQPVIPKSATKILDYLQVPSTCRSFAYATVLGDNVQEHELVGVVENAKSFVAFQATAYAETAQCKGVDYNQQSQRAAPLTHGPVASATSDRSTPKMAESVPGSAEAPLSATPVGAAASVEPLTRQSKSKESQSRDSSLSRMSPRTPAGVNGAAVDGTALTAATTARFITKQQSIPPGVPTPPSRSHSPNLREYESGSGHPPPTKRSPIRVGYLFKQSSGSWQRKRWNQRWFVLDNETGIFKYFRHESLPEAVPFRQDAHGVIHLKEPGASLVIQGDLPRNVPTPFCFTVCDASRSFLICADSNQDFREWTSAISAILSPRKVSTVDGVPLPLTGTLSKRAVTDSALNGAVSFARPALPAVTGESLLTKPKSPIRARPYAEQDDLTSGIRPTLRQTIGALLVINPLIAVVRYGSVHWMCVSLLGMNVYLVWMMWIAKPPSPTTRSTRQREEETDSFLDNASSDPFGSIPPGSPGGNIGSKSPRGSGSPRKQTLPRLEKLPSASFQPTKFLGVVNGIKVKAGDSVKMCPPAPAAFVAGCWTQISGTRFQVRQGPNYRKTKLKAPSDESLLDLAAVDIYRSSSKIDHIASIIDLGELKPENDPLDLLIVNCQVPSYQPSNPLWGEKQGNGEGFNFVSFFAISPAIREQLNQHEPSQQAVRLLKNFMQDNSSVRDRFKAIGIVVNPHEQKLGRTERHLLETYNGQPILTRPQHRFYRGDGYFEVDVDAHEFNFVARKGLVGVSEHFRNMVVDFGYVIEGQEDAELPEQMLGAVRLCKIDVRQALEIS